MLLLYLELFRTIVKVIRSCLTLPPHGLYSPWNSPGQNPGVGSLSLLQGIFPTQGSNPGLPHGRWILYQLSHQGNARILEWVAYPISSRSSRPRNRTRVSCCCVNREEVHLHFLRVFFFFPECFKESFTFSGNRVTDDSVILGILFTNTTHFCQLAFGVKTSIAALPRGTSILPFLYARAFLHTEITIILS